MKKGPSCGRYRPNATSLRSQRPHRGVRRTTAAESHSGEGKLTWAELDREGSTGSQDGVADGQAGGIFVALEGRSVVLELNNLADKLVPADLDQLVHLGAAHVLGDDEGTSDLENFTVLRRLLLKISICHIVSFIL